MSESERRGALWKRSSQGGGCRMVPGIVEEEGESIFIFNQLYVMKHAEF